MNNKLNSELDNALRLKELEVEKEVKLRAVELGKLTPVPSDHFDATKHVRLVPPFNKDEVDKFFSHFEKVAPSLKWPREVWTILVQSVLRGKVQKNYSSLSLDNSTDYDDVKKAVLKAYELVLEAYRQKFRNTKKLIFNLMLNLEETKKICLINGVNLKILVVNLINYAN